MLIHSDFQNKILKKISFDPFYVNKFYDMIKIQKNDAYLFENLNLKKKE